MIRCYSCDYEVDEDDREYECPFCGEEDMGEGFYRCENCGSLITYSGDEWECEACQNDGITRRAVNVYYDDDEDCYEDDEYCEDGIPDVNQGWVGEHYG